MPPTIPMRAVVATLLLLTAALSAQTTPPDAPIDALTRRDRNTLILTLAPSADQPRPLLLLHDFDFNGDPIDTAKLHLRQLAPGVYEITSLAYTVGYWRFRVTDNAAGYYGLGEHFDTLNHAHTVVHNLSMDDTLRKGSSTYKPIPFFLSTSGYGLWLDTTGEATFDLNAFNRDEVIIDAPTNRLRILLFTGGTEAGAGRFPAILAAFTALESGQDPATGAPRPRAILPPYWAFAPWQARDYYQNDAQVREDIERTRELGLPASVILIDSPWATAYNSYTFNPRQFDDAPGLIRHLHEAAFKLVLWHTSWINSKSDDPKEAGFGTTAEHPSKMDLLSPNYAEAAENGYFVRTPDNKPWVGHWWKGDGSLIDFTNPSAKLWWQNQVRLAIKAGADGFKDDDAEGAFFGGTGDVKFADGTDPRLMRNRYGTLYNNAVEELIQKDLHGNGVLFARSVTTGANGIGFLWGGDNEASFSPDNGLPTAVTAGISAGLSGMPLWGADIGGYLGLPDTPNPLLLQRWTEYAAFTPMMEVISSKNIVPWTFDGQTLDRQPVDRQTLDRQTLDRQTLDTNAHPGTTPASASGTPASASGTPASARGTPASARGTPALDTYKKFAILHMSLFPYRYAAAQAAVKTGLPILRALVLQYQDDSRARAIKDEYLFGPDLLVAPVIDENLSRAVYLPSGSWINLFTGEQFSGGRVIVAQAPANTIPVYARLGTILPKIPEDIMTLVPTAESGNKTVHTLEYGAQARRIYELIGPAAPTASSITDFEGRTVLRSDNTLQITGDSAAHIILRWRFTTPHSATVNGDSASITTPDGIPTIEFDHAATSTIAWQ